MTANAPIDFETCQKPWVWMDKGYRFVSFIENGKRRKIREHRLVMERHIGRKLEKYEDVHHRDHNKTNNDISNLELLTRSDHAVKHMTGDETILNGDFATVMHKRSGRKIEVILKKGWTIEFVEEKEPVASKAVSCGNHTGMSCAEVHLDDSMKIASLESALKASEKECEEQARLNGMGASRELKLIGQVTRLERERDAALEQLNVFRHCEKQLSDAYLVRKRKAYAIYGKYTRDEDIKKSKKS